MFTQPIIYTVTLEVALAALEVVHGRHQHSMAAYLYLMEMASVALAALEVVHGRHQHQMAAYHCLMELA